jgi:hypothetical protein
MTEHYDDGESDVDDDEEMTEEEKKKLEEIESMEDPIEQQNAAEEL